MRITPAQWDRLLGAARSARAHAYAPYSGYRVGAAILVASGRMHAGANVENASYGATICAERSAISAMVAAGDGSPVACAVVTAGPKPGTPCGICRQVLAEFGPAMPVLLAAEDDTRSELLAKRVVRLSALLPQAFRLLRARTGPAPMSYQASAKGRVNPRRAR